MPKQNITIGNGGADSRRVLDALTPLTSVGPPTVNATFIGQVYTDDTEGSETVYVSVNVGSVNPFDDWEVMNPTEVAEHTHLNMDPCDYIKFNTEIDEETIPQSVGVMRWNAVEETVSVRLRSDVDLSIGTEMYIKAVNKTGGILTNGSVVYVSGAQGNRPKIDLAANTDISVASKTIGLLTHNGEVNKEAFVTTHGEVHGLDTSDYDEGDILYLSDTPGELTKVLPIDGKARIRIGMVLVSHVNAGVVCINIKEEKYMFGDPDNGNYSYFEGDGTLVKKGDAITYRDEYVGGAYFVPGGANAPDEVSVTIAGVSTKKYSFDGVNTVEKLGNTFEVAHDVATEQVNSGDENIEIHVHFAPSDNATTGTIKWIVDWCLIKAQGAPIAGTQVSITKAITANKQYHNLIAGVSLPVPIGGFYLGDLIEFTLSRNPVDVEDTYAADVIFYKTALHVPCDTGGGSRQQYIK